MVKNKHKSYLETKACAICSNDSFKLVYSFPDNYYDRKKFETSSWDGRVSFSPHIVTCSKCGLVQTNPSFKESSLDLVYPEDRIKKIDVSKEFSFTKKYDELLKILTKYKKNGSLIDIGSRYGVFPWHAKKFYNFDSAGIELNKACVKEGNRFFKNIVSGGVLDIPKALKLLNKKKVNVITMDDVLEHLVHPLRDLNFISKYQNKGDIIIMRQMNFDSLGRKLFGRHWYYIQPAAHQYYFTKKND